MDRPKQLPDLFLLRLHPITSRVKYGGVRFTGVPFALRHADRQQRHVRPMEHRGYREAIRRHPQHVPPIFQRRRGRFLALRVFPIQKEHRFFQRIHAARRSLHGQTRAMQDGNEFRTGASAGHRQAIGIHFHQDIVHPAKGNGSQHMLGVMNPGSVFFERRPAGHAAQVFRPAAHVGLPRLVGSDENDSFIAGSRMEAHPGPDIPVQLHAVDPFG